MGRARDERAKQSRGSTASTLPNNADDPAGRNSSPRESQGVESTEQRVATGANLDAHRRRQTQFQAALWALSCVVGLWLICGVATWLGSSAGPSWNGLIDEFTLEQRAASAATSQLDLNLATAAELQCLPNVGRQLSQRIVRHREQVGGFDSVTQLADIPGIGPVRIESWKPYLYVSGEEAASDRENVQANSGPVSLASTLSTGRRSTESHRTVGAGVKFR